jgi:small nuclear ribonucleoprotein E
VGAATLIRPQGFDEYMNLVLDEAVELSTKRKTRKELGRVLLKGDNITLMLHVS